MDMYPYKDGTEIRLNDNVKNVWPECAVRLETKY